MDIERVSEIMESKGVIGVNYKGSPVWLQNIYEGNESVKVKDIKTDKEFNVEIKDLVED